MCGNCSSADHGASAANALGPDSEARIDDGPLPQSGVILIVEGRALCRAGAAALLASTGIEGRPAFAANLAEAMQAPDLHAARLLLVELSTIGFDFEGLRRLSGATKAPVVVVEEGLNPTFAGLAQRAGARGYVSKTFDIEQAHGVLRAVLGGGEHFPRAIRPDRSPATPLAAAGLSPRQREVLKCMALGMSNQEIGRALGITAGTVKLHINAVLRATGTRNRTEAALLASRFVDPLRA